MHRINGTMMAFSYKYGFISRGLIGTIYQGLNKILPVNMMTYKACVGYTLIVTLLFYGIVLCFFVFCLKKANIEYLNVMCDIMLFFTIFTVPDVYKRQGHMFCGKWYHPSDEFCK